MYVLENNGDENLARFILEISEIIKPIAIKLETVLKIFDPHAYSVHKSYPGQILKNYGVDIGQFTQGLV